MAKLRSSENRSDLEVFFGENLDVISSLPSAICDLVYIDPPFNTGKRQVLKSQRVNKDPFGARRGFKGETYSSTTVSAMEYGDSFEDYLEFIGKRLIEARRLLKPHGAIFVHLDYREAHYVKVFMDGVFGRDSFMNEIIWAYDYGGRPRRKWPAKHDTILWYVMDCENYTFNYDAMERIPYMAPGLVEEGKAVRGKTPTDTWWHTIVPTNGAERTGYPSQKPLGILNRIITVHSNPGDLVVDFFAGSGSTGEAALSNGRRALLVDSNPEAIEIMSRRLARWNPVLRGWEAALP